MEDRPSSVSGDGDGTSAGKKIVILLINPNATTSMTQNCLRSVKPYLPADVTVVGFTAPAPAPTAIEGAFDNVMSAAASMRAIIELKSNDGIDAMLVACYSNHHLVPMLREEFEVPVIGIMEASLFHARTLGARFGIIATGKRSAIGHRDSVRSYGMSDFCAGIRPCNLGVLDLEQKPREHVVGVMRQVARTLVEDDGADVLTLGCAGMIEMKTAVDEAVEDLEGGSVQVVDGVLAGVQHLVGIVRLGGKTAKRGLWASSAGGRARRGQTYV
ncbi:hypothetical protein K431DRAFT_318027 [Polychaeton citri CBS 116435]|uniref:Hydantoin racemase n=1 Tax=Polychaeton citri CBS 116435 TaxID=1314669 RepID=A0A9P4QCD7_9PEZI|nr:hypothetical protein K431DRAFT_318027 [Polychaeton citri CBS 116435]